ncbi:hypothetical protein COSMO_3 [Mycobacterium phage Cosmo]|uniref:Uncharacterized protein n=1 Tax=Mycobacterium phage Cosmo TaxID=1567467 RepID=A0A0B5A325_9CAUD|nr:hypothetical protein COSMO_3 [Mycobacterium phage Cosmo]
MWLCKRYHGKHRLSDNRRTLGIVEWQPIGFCRRIGWYGRWDYDFSLCPMTYYHYDDDGNLVGTTRYPGHL